MEMKNWAVEKTGDTAAEVQDSGKSTGFENAKNSIADKLHKVAEALAGKAANQDAPSGIAQYGKQASEWLDQSADYVRQFYYKQADARVREYVRQSPALRRSLAGKNGGSKEGAGRFLERKNGKAIAKATLKTKKRAV